MESALTGHAEGRLGIQLRVESPRRSFGKEGGSCDARPTARDHRVNVWGSERAPSTHRSNVRCMLTVVVLK
jgi:hypothetical protein